MSIAVQDVALASVAESPLFVHEFLRSVKPDDMVLDLGCGAGSVDYKLYRCRFVACDTLRDFDRQRAPTNVTFLNAHAGRLPFRPELFHAVICNWIFEHLDDPAAVIREIERVLAPQGYLYMSIPRATSLEDRLYRFLYKDQGGHVQRYDLESILRLVYATSSFKLVSFADWGAGFVYLQYVRAGGELRRALFLLLRLVKRFTGRRLNERSNYVLLFQRHDGTGHRQMTDVCSFCGSGHRVPTPHHEAAWVCPSCGKVNPYV
jgi:SAM-dependent methyltransferase